VFQEHKVSEHYSTHTTVAAFGDTGFAVAYYDGGAEDAGTLVAGAVSTGLGVATGTAVEGDQVQRPSLHNRACPRHLSLCACRCLRLFSFLPRCGPSFTSLPSVQRLAEFDALKATFPPALRRRARMFYQNDPVA
jgi:hypothetical protein